jgi:hypothetical protein
VRRDWEQGRIYLAWAEANGFESGAFREMLKQ